MNILLFIMRINIRKDQNGYRSKFKRNSNISDFFDYQFSEDSKGKDMISFKAVISDSILGSFNKKFNLK